MNNAVLWLWLRLALKNNRRMMDALRQVAGDIHAIYNADRNTYLKWGVPTKHIAPLCNKDTRKAEQIHAASERFGYHILTIDDEDYPPLLREIALPPCVLFF